MHGLKQVPKSDAKCLYHHIHPDQSGFDILAVQRVATNLLQLRIGNPIPTTDATARARRARPQALGV